MMTNLQNYEPLVLDFVTRFLGYGSLAAPVWFVGPGAGGGASIDELYGRMRVWDERGRVEIEDLQQYHRALKLPTVPDWSSKEQATWAALIRIIFAIAAKDPIAGDVLRFQVDGFGKSEGDFCVLDVSQISCKKKQDWILGPSGITWLRTKRDYQEEFLKPRGIRFRKLLDSNAPNLVFLYGTFDQPQDLWGVIAGKDKTWECLELPKGYEIAWPGLKPKLFWMRSERTLFIKMPHPGFIRPSGPGSRIRFFAGLGRAIREKLDPAEPRLRDALDRFERWLALQHPKFCHTVAPR